MRLACPGTCVHLHARAPPTADWEQELPLRHQRHAEARNHSTEPLVNARLTHPVSNRRAARRERPLAAMSREGLAGVAVKQGSAPPLPTQGVRNLSFPESHLSNRTGGGSARDCVTPSARFPLERMLSPTKETNGQPGLPSEGSKTSSDSGRSRDRWTVEADQRK
jgi:hypothetical protein